jgi:hypothetical protein
VSTPFEPNLAAHSEAFLAEVNAQLKQQLNAAAKELEYARYCSEPRLAYNKTVVTRYRISME